jgi:hypothetical protein
MITSYQNEIVRAGSAEIGVLFPITRKAYLAREAVPNSYKRNEEFEQTLLESTQHNYSDATRDVLIRLPSVTQSHPKVTVLQQWLGRVERVVGDEVIAVISDTTHPRNPLEEISLSVDEIPSSDLPLASQGAVFYWTIGYRDTLGGQRERVSTIRFARQPRLSDRRVKEIFQGADEIAALLGCE